MPPCRRRGGVINWGKLSWLPVNLNPFSVVIKCIEKLLRMDDINTGFFLGIF